MAHDVFISYAQRDKLFADALCHGIEAEGVRCWIAPRDATAGTDQKTPPVEAIRSCRIMVLVASGETTRSAQLQQELDVGLEAGSQIISFQVQDPAVVGERNDGLHTRHWLEALTPPLEIQIERFARDVRTIVTQSPPLMKASRIGGSGMYSGGLRLAAIAVLLVSTALLALFFFHELGSRSSNAALPGLGPEIGSGGLGPTPTQPDSSADPVVPTPPTVVPLLADQFDADRALDERQWSVRTGVLRSFASRVGFGVSESLVDPQLTFGHGGMVMSGVSGRYQFTGIQSRKTFTPPFQLVVGVAGLIAHGNTFVVYLGRGDLNQGLTLNGNLNPHNGPYYGMSLEVGRLGSGTKTTIVPAPALGVRYTIGVAVSASGAGRVTVTDDHHKLVGSATNLPLGSGPFILVLAQMEGAPYSVGPNEALWANAFVAPDR